MTVWITLFIARRGERTFVRGEMQMSEAFVLPSGGLRLGSQLATRQHNVYVARIGLIGL